jgi:hypothetical protein
MSEGGFPIMYVISILQVKKYASSANNILGLVDIPEEEQEYRYFYIINDYLSFRPQFGHFRSAMIFDTIGTAQDAFDNCVSVIADIPIAECYDFSTLAIQEITFETR